MVFYMVICRTTRGHQPILISFVFLLFLLPISIRFRYLDHLIANRMVHSMLSGPQWNEMGVVGFKQFWGHIYFRGPPVVIRLTCDCAVADDAVMPIRAESSS